jgi:integrase
MQYDIRGPNSRNLYYTRLKDGRIKTAATKELLVQKLDKMWILPNKQNKDSMSIGDLLQRYIRHLEKRTHGRIDGQKRIREQSYENYLSYSRAIWNFDNQRFADGFGKRITVFNKNIIDYKIENVDRNFLNEFLNQLEINFVNKSSKHKHEIFSFFKGALLWLNKQDKELYPIPDLEDFVVKQFKKESFVPKRLDAQLVLRTVDQVCKEKYAIYVYLCSNGLRASEANGLKPSDFDWTNNTVHIQRIVDRARRVIAIETGYEIATKTQSSNRKVPLGSELATRIRKFIMSNPNLEWMFQSEQKYDGRPIKQQNLARFGLHKALEHLKEKGQNVEWKGAMHGLRHYYGSLLLAEAAKLGRNPTWVQKRLGHSNLQTTLGIYSHDIDEDNQELNNEVERRLNG